MPEDHGSGQLVDAFEAHRAHLRAVAYRMLGSTAEADDAVQEAWLRLSRSDTSAVDNLGGWLTTVVARVCLNVLRSRRIRREDPLDAAGLGPGGPGGPAEGAGPAGGAGAGPVAAGPEHEAVLADSVGIALLIVLDTLAPAERLAFVLHDLFALPFDEIAPIVGRTPVATRQLASRARRRVQAAAASAGAGGDEAGSTAGSALGSAAGGHGAGSAGPAGSALGSAAGGHGAGPGSGPEGVGHEGSGSGSGPGAGGPGAEGAGAGGRLDRRRRQVVDAFLAAARGGDLDALLAVLDPDVVLRADAASGPTGVPQVVRGAADVSSGALRFSERARISRPALVDGRPGLVVAPAGHRVGALVFTIVGDVITEIEITGDAGALGRMEVAYLDG